MIYKRFGNKLVIRLVKGEKVVASIREVLEKEKVYAGNIQAIGALGYVNMGIYNPDKKTYDNMEINKMVELTALLGNASVKDDELYTHFHITIGDEKGNAHAGHLNEAVVSMTAEIFVDIIDGHIGRIHDEETGINLLDF
ncbi:MAG: DNA-binding protein [Tissierellia bacterium]|nr:DNA-binding protein [Tissierellia bacterium]